MPTCIFRISTCANGGSIGAKRTLRTRAMPSVSNSSTTRASPAKLADGATGSGAASNLAGRHFASRDLVQSKFLAQFQRGQLAAPDRTRIDGVDAQAHEQAQRGPVPANDGQFARC